MQSPAAREEPRNQVPMKFALFLLLPLVVLWILSVVRGNAARQAAAEVSRARARTAARRPRVPVVSNNVKGVTASQTIAPVRPQGA